MELSNELIRKNTARILKTRMKLLHKNPFYGLLLMYLKINLSEDIETASTDGKRIYLNPDFLNSITDSELEYVLSHELLHIVLKHLERFNKSNELVDQAADIIVNSNILRANNFRDTSISLSQFGGVQIHQAPDGTEGWTHSLEELYLMLLTQQEAADNQDGDEDSEENAEGSSEDETDCESDDGKQEDLEDSDVSQPNSSGNNGGLEDEQFGFGNEQENSQEDSGSGNGSKSKGWDSHDMDTDSSDGSSSEADEWDFRIYQAAKQAKEFEETVKLTGSIPGFVERHVDELQEPTIDWRTVLEEFVQSEINDYSFCPPDRRFDDSPFFLPDFNERDDKVEKILFMIDTSASMSDDEVRRCYSEIKGAIDQFNGKIEGWLGFFDAAIVPPVPFIDEDEFRAIHPEGGGGTAFDIIFDYVNKEMKDEPPLSIVILTDGGAPFPKVECTKGIPTLWIINNEVVDPPWGKVARIPSSNNIYQ
ncbi:DUF2201 family putative metallopeptidase [Pseudobutyrivibrio xylanivorans]|uniref:Metallopeptidase domain-containing protein n=1 Tax=Pseudobutyrivibrio xylanivorans TaxID=185007 RepID=A0A5P6VM44_PSEXY|nr:VWA-like domain-containing protein [Pseudobutyrivibrio xylanivorans]QFJ53428.1 hypothetical protein FXF36_00335 [Pseudobutyrivibrio xylanivorans]